MLHIITGPPCAGKSTYVREHARDGDVVVDFDAIATALGSHQSHDAPEAIRQCAFAARDAAISHVMEAGAEAWVIHTRPTDAQRAAYDDAGAEWVELDPGYAACMSRAVTDGRPQRSVDAIREWYGQSKGGKLRYKDAGSIEVSDGGHFAGYAATFHRDPDCYGDVIAKGAFADTLDTWNQKAGRGIYIPLLYGHNTSDPEYNIGRVTKAFEDETGLYVEGDFDADNPKAQYVRKLASEGRLYQFSFAYDVCDEARVKIDGAKANELRKLDLYEVSLVQIPANQHAELLDVKSADDGTDGTDGDDGDDGEAVDDGGDTAVDTDAIADALDSMQSAFGEVEQAIQSAIDQIKQAIGGDDPAGDSDGDEVKPKEPTEANGKELKDYAALIKQAENLVG